MNLAELRRIAEPPAMVSGGLALLIAVPGLTLRADAFGYSAAAAAAWTAWVLIAGGVARWRGRD